VQSVCWDENLKYKQANKNGTIYNIDLASSEQQIKSGGGATSI